MLALCLLISMIVATGLGPVSVPPGMTMRIVLGHMTAFDLSGRAAIPPVPSIENNIIWLIRAPRIVLGAIVGASLAVVGAALQSVTANRLADPHLLGVSSGATLGAVTATLYLGAILGPLTLPALAFVGALLAMILVVALGAGRGRFNSERLLLSGVAVSFVMAASANLLLYMGDQRAAASVLFWMLGGLGLARWEMLPAPALAALIGISWLLARRRELNALMTGDATAASLGVPVARVRAEIFVVCSLLTASMVAVSGAIGFVGLVAPHICRKLVGGEHRRLLPMTALFGAILLLWADVAARTMIAPEDLPIGIVTALFGGVSLLVLMRTK